MNAMAVLRDAPECHVIITALSVEKLATMFKVQNAKIPEQEASR